MENILQWIEYRIESHIVFGVVHFDQHAMNYDENYFFVVLSSGLRCTAFAKSFA